MSATFSKSAGRWCVRVVGGSAGASVEVTKRDGSTAWVTLGSQVAEDLWLPAVPTLPAARGRTYDDGYAGEDPAWADVVSGDGMYETQT